MRDPSHQTFKAVDGRDFRHAATAFLAESDHEPPAPTQMLARLGALLVIALGFGLVAQILVGAPL